MKTHRFDALSFLAGLVIAGIGLAFLLLPEVGDLVDFITNAGTWFWPVLFLAIGVAVLAPVVSPSGTEPGEHDEEIDEIKDGSNG